MRLPFAKFEEESKKQSLAAINDCKSFMQHPDVHQASEWKEIENAKPPRGTLARVARRAAVALHPTLKRWAWKSTKEVRREICDLIRWYKPGRKVWRRRRGIRRGHAAGPWRRGRLTVMTAKVIKHLKNLASKWKLEGLMN
jgi:hypothetical protein